MKIEHIAIWVNDIETLKDFYKTYFLAKSNSKYVNEKTKFESYFLSFSSGTRLELMQRPDIIQKAHDNRDQEFIGYAHLAMSVGSEEVGDKITQQLIQDGHSCVSGPRRTGDGYYESVILDPAGNRVEITI